MSIFSANREGRLLTVTAAEPAFDGGALDADYRGSGHAVTIDRGQGRPGSDSALALPVVSRNPADTSVGVRGRQTGRGTPKVTHEKPRGAGGNDASAAGLSIKLEAAGTAAKGLFVDSRPATAGRLADVRDAGIHLFVVGPDGWASCRSTGPGRLSRDSRLRPARAGPSRSSPTCAGPA